MEETPWGFKSPLSQMKKLLVILLFVMTAPLWAVKVNPNCRGFDTARKREQVELFDFGGLYPQLERINIDGHKKKCVELDLTGEYPVLKNITFDGSFGKFTGELTGSFPVLTDLDVKVTSNQVKLDLRGHFGQDCNILITGTTADVTLHLPKDVGLDIKTKTSMKGKVKADHLKKKGLFRKKRFCSNLEAPVTLTLFIEVSDGQITLL